MKQYRLVRSLDVTTFEYNLNYFASQGYELARFEISPKNTYVAVMVKETIKLADDMID